MTLHELIDPLPRAALAGAADLVVTGVRDNSGAVGAGDVFVAVKGATVDGHDFISAAIEAGAVAIVAEQPARTDLPEGTSWVLVPDSRQALGVLSSVWCGNPSLDLRVAGVTGTNGKTTTAFLIHSILKRTMQRAGLIGTVVFDDGQKEKIATHTTPGTLEMQELFARMRDHGCPAVALEVSSQGLEQGRADSIAFDVGVFTNLTQDHLDYHGSMESYFASKKILFDKLVEDEGGKRTTAVVNRDDAYGEVLVREYADKVKLKTYGFGLGCDFKAGNVKQTSRATEFQLYANGKSYLVRLPHIGRFNVYNALAALAAVSAMRVPLREAVAALADAPQVPGRMECVGLVDSASVFVDYAHTPDALYNVCRALRELEPRRLITVFGCGGDRDREKRALMGKVASKYSDYCFVTSDNPRSEDPERIMAQIERGMSGSVYERMVSREEAIGAAIQEARGGDIVLIAGKGHEDYQELADGRIPFDDRKLARAAMETRRKKRGEERP
ncbi:MAG: UDP-N-acetylmuramoyl-L-alanyl-D-glutamate--2,6-diaminopimelate ligase [Roseibacillus sp.]|nr:UDP-N-acetylmuramoyl-L-alanyl-D-glutamate--2,6-diaminopimelate ligase [Roseibacillus sp.]